MKELTFTGVVKEVIQVGDNVLTLIFLDKDIGEVYLYAARGETDLYFNLSEDAEYKLTVYLFGMLRMERDARKGWIQNILKIKSYEIVEG